MALSLATQVRRAKDADAASVVALLQEAGLEVAFDPREFVVAVEGGRLVGCARLKALPDGSRELASVAVAADRRGERIGEALTREALRDASGDVYALALQPGFFERQGFRRLAEVPAPLREKASTVCASSGFVSMVWTPTEEQARAAIRAHYAGIAIERAAAPAGECCEAAEGGACSLPQVPYSPEELAQLPEGAYLALGTGNPVRAADPNPGDVVVDLGSGAGVDVILAARRVGPQGRAIGVDFTPEMVARARENLRRAGLANAEIREGPIEKLPLADATADVVVSNCVINLSTEKATVLQEARRVLRPGGRFVVSDTLRLPGTPQGEKPSCDCTTGAMSAGEWRRHLEAAGFEDVRVTMTSDGGCCGKSVGSALVEARRP